MDFKRRLNKIRQKIKKYQADGLLVSNFYHLYYLAGFLGLSREEREGWLFVTQKEGYFFTDGRYQVKVGDDYPYKVKIIRSAKDIFSFIKRYYQQKNYLTLAIEADDLKVNEYLYVKKTLKNVKMIPSSLLIVEERMIKDEEEITKIKKACWLTDNCLSFLKKSIKKGQKEKEIAWLIERWVKEKGYQLAFSPIVAIDKNSAVPHYNTQINGQEKVKDGSLILIDMGVMVENYCSDITRIFFFNQLSQRQIIVYQNLLKAQEKTINFIKIKQKAAEVDFYCRSQLKNYPFYSHATGHGVGLQPHELPKISSYSDDDLKGGMVFTIEPGVYLQGEWGMRIEDTVYLNEKGETEVLTKFSKEIQIIK